MGSVLTKQNVHHQVIQVYMSENEAVFADSELLLIIIDNYMYECMSILLT